MPTLGDRGKWLLATCAGCGHSPVLPGTAGALWGVAFFLPVAWLTPEPAQSLLILAALAAASVVTVWLGPWAERYFGEKDCGKFVTDEVAGFLLTVLLFRTPDVVRTTLWAFTVTRIIDIVKVPPARTLERIPGGWGVLVDDLLGSLYAAGLLHLLAWWMPQWFA